MSGPPDAAAPSRAARWRWTRRLAIVIAFLISAAVVAVAALQIRLSEGPIAIPQLVAWIERSLSREFSDTPVRIDEVWLYRAESSGRLEFRLNNLRLLDKTGATVVRVPTAAIDISRNALVSWSVAPKRIDLIRPRIVMSYDESAGLSLRLAGFQPRPGPASAADVDVPPQPLGDNEEFYQIAAPPGSRRDVGLVDVLKDTFKAARERRAATSFLKSVGVRDAVVVMRTRTAQTVWTAPEFTLELRHQAARSLIRGTGKMTDREAPFEFGFEIDDTPARGAFVIRTLFKDLVPAEFARAVPELAALGVVDAPISGKSTFELAQDGSLAAATGDIVVGAGYLGMSDGAATRVTSAATRKPSRRMQVEEGQALYAYDAASGTVRFDKLDLITPRARLVVAGEVRRFAGAAARADAAPSADTPPTRDTDSYAFALAGKMRMASRDGSPAPLSDVNATGLVDPARDELRVDTLTLAWPELQVAGRMRVSATDGFSASGQIGETSKSGLLAAWPTDVAVDARSWVAAQVEVGRVAGGRFSISVPTDIAARLAKGGDVPSEAIAVDLEARDLSVRYLNAMPALDFPLARLSVRGRTLRLKAAAGTTTPEGARPIRLSKSDMVVRDLRETRPSAQIFTALEGDVRDALAYLHQAPFSKLDVGDVRKRIEGRAKGTLRLQFAMHPALKREEIRVNGKLKVSDAEAKNIYADLDLAGGALTFDVTEKSVEASGDVLVNGVPAKVRWLRLLNSDEARQPPLRLSARLDAADRRALGINVNHFVEGIVAADVVLTPRRGAPPAISVQADLTQAGIALDYLAWRKEAGQSALTQFDVALDKQGAPRLENFKVVGENISIDGALTLGKDRRVRTFSLGEFTIGVVTQMTVKGALGADNVWDVSVQSPSFDARPLFRALFSPKRLSAHVPPKETRRDGLVIRARIRNLIGYDGMTMKDTRIVLERRDGKIRALEANGVLGGGQQLRASLSAGEDGRRRLRAETKDAGAAFRLIGFYNNVRRGEAKLRVNLDNAGPAEVTGTLWTRNFFMLGDPIVNEVLESSRQTDTGGNVRGIETQKEGGTRRTVIRFTQLRFNFSVGNGQFVLRRSYVNGPALGATLEGKVDFEQRTVNLGGAYVPFYGLNSAIGNVPVLGDLFVGKRGEGMFAVTFGVKGSLARPAVLVNPMSIMAPGALRELFRIEPGNQQITPGTRRPPPRAPRSAPATGSWAHERDR